MKTLIATAGLTIMFLSAGAFAGSNDKAATCRGAPRAPTSR